MGQDAKGEPRMPSAAELRPRVRGWIAGLIAATTAACMVASQPFNDALLPSHWRFLQSLLSGYPNVFFPLVIAATVIVSARFPAAATRASSMLLRRRRGHRNRRASADPPIAASQAHSLGWLALLLPAAERSRFVAEALGNLGDCERWWQRVDHLVCLALGMPRLAWMMRRDGRRGRV